jgi:G3E family GTPase
VNVLCIAGFLGSGKTTVLLEVARVMAEDGLKLAVVENEIGEVGIDGSYVRDQGLPVQELFGGCICCTLQAGLAETLLAVESDHDPDWVIIEPTGLAAPGARRSAGACGHALLRRAVARAGRRRLLAGRPPQGHPRRSRTR